VTTVTLVVAAESDTSPGIWDLLRDWSAVGLLESFVWIEERDITPDVPLSRLPVTVLEAGLVRRVGLGEHLANQDGVRLIRLAALSGAGPGGAVVAGDRAATIWNDVQGAGMGRVVPLHCIVTRHGTGGWDPSACWLGWQNLVLAPEQAWNPTEFREILHASGDDAEFLAHAACGLLSICGLWRGVGEGPFDKAQPPAPGTALVVRAFVRSLDASAVTAAVARKTTDLSRGLPQPQTTNRARLEYIEDIDSAMQEMSAVLQDKHAALLTPRREVPRVEPPKPISLMAAVRMFLSFLVAALKGAPRAWLHRVVTSAATGVAGVAQHVVFGDAPSLYRVTLLGRDASGRLAGAEVLTADNEQIATQLRQVKVNVDMMLPDLGPFWQDFVGGALTLADGGGHVAGMDPISQGPNPGIVRHPTAIAPAPSDQFKLSGALATQVHSAPIEPTDAFTARRVRMELKRILGEDPMRGAAAAQQLEELETWFRPHARTYVGRVGDRIARFAIESWEDIEKNRQIIERGRGDAEVGAKIERAQERQARRQRWLFVALVVAVVGSTVLAVLVQPLLGVLVALGCLLIWFVTAVWSFWTGQRDLFHLLHERERNAQLAEVALRNLGYAVADLNRATVMYSQYMCWSGIIGGFLAEPFGRQSSRGEPRPLLDGALPRSFGLGVAVPDDARVERSVAEVRGKLFKPGWLGATWEGFLASIPGRIGPAGHELAGNTDAMFRDKARDEESPLRLWVADVRASGVDPALGDAVLVQARDVLVRDSAPGDFAALLGTVKVLGQQHHGITERTAAKFFGDLAHTVRSDTDTAFDLALFAPQAQGRDHQVVRRTLVSATAGSRAGLDNVLVDSPVPSGLESGLSEQSSLDQLVVMVQCADPVPASLVTLARPGELPVGGVRERAEPAPPRGPDL